MRATPDIVTENYITEQMLKAADAGISPHLALNNIRDRAIQVGHFISEWADGHPLWNFEELVEEAKAIRKFREGVMERLHSIGLTKDSRHWWNLSLEKEDILKTAP